MKGNVQDLAATPHAFAVMVGEQHINSLWMTRHEAEAETMRLAAAGFGKTVWTQQVTITPIQHNDERNVTAPVPVHRSSGSTP